MRLFKHSHRLLLTATLLALIAAPLQIVAQTPAASGPKPMQLLECLPDPRGGPPICEIMIDPQNPFSVLNAYLQPLFPWMMAIAAGLTVLMIIVGGFQIMLAGGEQGGQSAGKDRIKAVLLGLLILLFSAAILNTLNSYYYRLGGSP